MKGGWRFASAVLALAVLIVGPVVWCYAPEPTRISAANAARIRPAMTRDEVEAILGGPPHEELYLPSNGGLVAGSFKTGYLWYSPDKAQEIEVRFDPRGCVERAAYTDNRPPSLRRFVATLLQ